MHWLHLLIAKADPYSVGLCGTSTLLSITAGNGLNVLSAICVLTTIVYNFIKIRKELKK